MAGFDDIGEQDSWRCWVCDKAVDATASVNDERGPSVDARITGRKAKKRGKHKVGGLSERLAHRGCNTGKGNVEAVVPWKADLFVIDPVAIVQTVDRLANKGGREIFCRCPTQQDADTTAAWLIDRISRLEPGLTLSSDVQEGGGQYLVALRT